MKSMKLLVGTIIVAGFGFFVGTNKADAATMYTVNSGDTLSSISSSFFGNGSGVDAIAAANNITNVNMIYAGQELTIPTEGETVAVATTTATEVPQTSTTAAVDTTTDTTTTAATVSGSDAEAKEWIAMKESSGSYTATNGQYYGRYQLTSSYLNGDYSAENQERVADSYVTGRYGSWSAAKEFWLANGWY